MKYPRDTSQAFIRTLFLFIYFWFKRKTGRFRYEHIKNLSFSQNFVYVWYKRRYLCLPVERRNIGGMRSKQNNSFIELQKRSSAKTRRSRDHTSGNQKYNFDSFKDVWKESKNGLMKKMSLWQTVWYDIDAFDMFHQILRFYLLHVYLTNAENCALCKRFIYRSFVHFWYQSQ